MTASMVKSVTMPDIEEYRSLQEAADDPRVPYTIYWLRKLCKAGTVKSTKFGEGAHAVWLVHLPSLLEYIREMETLGTQKHHPG